MLGEFTIRALIKLIMKRIHLLEARSEVELRSPRVGPRVNEQKVRVLSVGRRAMRGVLLSLDVVHLIM